MKDRVIRYIEQFGSITTKQAFVDLGCTRLSEYIRQIRLERPVYDETISSKNRYGENVWYKKFYFKEQK
ncbi:MAG: hypothetical protein IKE89_03560 [Bacilli bacterium]|nr:hypothetical protein [Bacilli bacterium]MBR2711529.1 hypothetical protein [Bacilli bacterium]